MSEGILGRGLAVVMELIRYGLTVVMVTLMPGCFGGAMEEATVGVTVEGAGAMAR